MGQQKRFTKAFEDEAVRLALTSGRTRRSVAADLGVGLSTLTRWIGRSRDRKPEGAAARNRWTWRPKSSACAARTRSFARNATS
jgi:transposase-like protein